MSIKIGNKTIAGNPDLSGKQDVLISGENIKTINNESLLGEGNIEVLVDVEHATESVAGTIEIATAAETQAGTVDTKAVTPKKLKTELDKKQGTISDLDTIRSNASSAKSTVDTHVANGTIHVTASDKIAWSQKQPLIDDLETIRSNATAGKGAADTIANYGDIVSHNASEFQPAGDYATNTRVNTVEAIAKGKSTGYVFDTKAAMDTWIASHTADLQLGDNLYIRATDVPDYWWDGSAAQELETQKVDLTDYAKTADVVPNTRKVNNKALSADVTLTATDVGALPTGYHDDTKQDKLTAGTNISIENNTISVTGDLGTKVTFVDWRVN